MMPSCNTIYKSLSCRWQEGNCCRAHRSLVHSSLRIPCSSKNATRNPGENYVSVQQCIIHSMSPALMSQCEERIIFFNFIVDSEIGAPVTISRGFFQRAVILLTSTQPMQGSAGICLNKLLNRPKQVRDITTRGGSQVSWHLLLQLLDPFQKPSKIIKQMLDYLQCNT